MNINGTTELRTHSPEPTQQNPLVKSEFVIHSNEGHVPSEPPQSGMPGFDWTKLVKMERTDTYENGDVTVKVRDVLSPEFQTFPPFLKRDFQAVSAAEEILENAKANLETANTRNNKANAYCEGAVAKLPFIGQRRLKNAQQSRDKLTQAEKELTGAETELAQAKQKWQQKRNLFAFSDYSFVTDEETAIRKMNKWTERAKAVITKQCERYKTWLFEDTLSESGEVHLKSSNLDRFRRDIHYLTPSSGIGVAQVQGCSPKTNTEDRHFSKVLTVQIGNKDYNIPVQGVADGHSGEKCSEYVSTKIFDFLEVQLKSCNQNDFTKAGILNALDKTIVELNRTYYGDGGTTVNFSLIIEDTIYVANSGDSRAVLISPDECFQLSIDSNPSDLYERNNIERRGGEIGLRKHDEGNWGVKLGREGAGKLPMSRSVGDHKYGGVVNSGPTVTCRKLPENLDGWVILHATDGLFGNGVEGSIHDGPSSQQVGNLVRELLEKGTPLSHIAAILVHSSWQLGTIDDITAMPVSLKEIMKDVKKKDKGQEPALISMNISDVNVETP